MSSWFGPSLLVLVPVVAPLLGQGTAQSGTRGVQVVGLEALVPQGPRVALVIGNGAYKDAPLKNPVNDARAMAAKLRTLGFEVISRENLTQKQIGSTLRAFRSRLSAGAEALFFYAGHGLQVNGVNYLPVVDAEIFAEEDVPTQSLDVSKILELMEAQKTRLNLVFLDACRNNPYARSFRAAGGGLAKITPPSGTILSYATRPGSVAADGTGTHGLYTEHLLRAMDEPGVLIEQALKKVLAGVKRASNGKQEPWVEGGIEGDFSFVPGPVGAGVAGPPPALGAPPPVAPMLGGLQVHVNAADAEVFVEGKLRGSASATAALNLRDQPAGRVLVRVEAPGYTPSEQMVTVQGGEWAAVRFLLDKVAVSAPSKLQGSVGALRSSSRARAEQGTGGATARLAVKVQTPDGIQVATAQVVLKRLDIMWQKQLKVGSDGQCLQVGLPDERFELVITAPGCQGLVRRIAFAKGATHMEEVVLVALAPGMPETVTQDN